ncbi:MAG: ABC transporter ATP-binding protein [Acidobacteriia bacterium]|nr:ABC transporter ATP-binding protein [Terriglobia bacterium]
MLLTAKGISKRFGANTVLQDASFSVADREVLGLIGPNGAGKTTLFECLAGLIPTHSGEVTFHGQALAPAQRKESLFYLPDGIRPWPDQTVAWALSFFEALFGRPKGEGAALAEALQLGALMKSRVGSLSKGESKRALLALGLLTPQPLLLLDEPFDGLDFRQTREVMALLRTVPAKGRTLFLSIHQLTDASRVCDRLVLLSRGQVVGEGTLPELRTQAGLAEGGLEEVFLALT